MNSKLNKKKFIRIASAGVLAVAVFSAGILTGCEAGNSQNSKDAFEQQESVNTEQNQNKSQDSDVKAVNQGKVMDDFNALLEGDAPVIEVVKFMDENLSLITRENAAAMVDGFEQLQKKFLPELEEKFYNGNDIQAKIMQLFEESEFDLNKIYDTEDAQLKELLTETKDSGYKVETAEGTFFPVINYEFYKKYSDYVPSDVSEYIELMAVESNNVPAKDAAIVISWEDILKRALNQEKFIAQYGDSAKVQAVKDLYKKYLTFTLLGANNTPLFSYDTKAMDAKAKQAYLEAVENSGDSEFLKTVSGYMDLLKKTDYKLTDEVDKYRKNIIEKLK
jgi:hypothetical protein